MDGKRQRKEVYGEKQEKKKNNKVEEIQLANLARPSQAKIVSGFILDRDASKQVTPRTRSANNKAKTLRMGNVNRRKFTEKKEGEKG